MPRNEKCWPNASPASHCRCGCAFVDHDSVGTMCKYRMRCGCYEYSAADDAGNTEVK